MGLVQQVKPVCVITGGSKTAATLQARLVSCSVTDVSGSESDSIKIEIDARGLSEWPETGQVIGCKMGYEDTGVVDLGRFKLGSITENCSPHTFSLTGTAAPFQAKDETEFKRRRSKSWLGETLGSMVQAIAKRHGFSPRVDPELSGIPTFHVDQTDETDIAFLNRMAKKHDAVCKPVNELLVFCRKGQVKSLSGRKLEPVVIEWPEDNRPGAQGFTSASVSSADKSKAGGVTAHWYNPGSGIEERVELGGKPRKRLSDTYDDEAEARQAAEAEMRKMAREGDRVQFDLPGNPLLAAEGLIEFQGGPSERLQGSWSADRIMHSYSTRGYRCSGSATKPVG